MLSSIKGNKIEADDGLEELEILSSSTTMSFINQPFKNDSKHDPEILETVNVADVLVEQIKPISIEVISEKNGVNYINKDNLDLSKDSENLDESFKSLVDSVLK